MEKICSKCKLEKDVEKFNNNKIYADGKDLYCGECRRKYMNKRYRKKNPRKIYELTFNGVDYECKTIKEITQITGKSRFCVYRILNNKNTYKINKHKYLKEIKIKIKK